MQKKFPKKQKLKSAKTIENLFLEGKTHSKYPLKVFFLPKPHPMVGKVSIESNLAAFAVPKRSFKSAVDRNRIKRQLREVYRLNKHRLNEKLAGKFVLLFLFLGKEKPKYAELEKAMTNLLLKLSQEVD
ncbi:MAG TPA: ribonuclease P protein component [Aequorivita sp.]|nr:ribonuclease P protein component [Aequorivita sp.]